MFARITIARLRKAFLLIHRSDTSSIGFKHLSVGSEKIGWKAIKDAASNVHLIRRDTIPCR